MSRFFASLALIALVFTAAPRAQGTVSGAWDLSINGPQGSINAAATLKQDGEKLTGTLTSPQGDVEMAGTIKGNAIALAFKVESPQGPLDVKINGDVTGAEMKGVIDFGMGQAEFTGKKK